MPTLTIKLIATRTPGIYNAISGGKEIVLDLDHLKFYHLKGIDLLHPVQNSNRRWYASAHPYALSFVLHDGYVSVSATLKTRLPSHHQAPPAEYKTDLECPRCSGRGYVNHKRDGRICYACNGKGSFHNASHKASRLAAYGKACHNHNAANKGRTVGHPHVRTGQRTRNARYDSMGYAH